MKAADLNLLTSCQTNTSSPESCDCVGLTVDTVHTWPEPHHGHEYEYMEYEWTPGWGAVELHLLWISLLVCGTLFSSGSQSLFLSREALSIMWRRQITAVKHKWRLSRHEGGLKTFGSFSSQRTDMKSPKLQFILPARRRIPADTTQGWKTSCKHPIIHPIINNNDKIKKLILFHFICKLVVWLPSSF